MMSTLMELQIKALPSFWWKAQQKENRNPSGGGKKQIGTFGYNPYRVSEGKRGRNRKER